MKHKRSIAFAAAGLTVGLIVGSIGMAGAATTAPTAPAAPQAQGAGGYGMRLGGVMRDAGGRLADVVAKLTGLPVDDVFAQREAGKSYADIAESKGVSSDQVVNEALDVRKAALDAKVKDGTISAETEAAALDRMETNLKARVESTDPADCNGGAGGMGRGQGQGRGMGRGQGGGQGGAGGCGGACTQTAPTSATL